MKTLPIFFLLATLAISAGHAQESPVTGPPPCRFLFYVESSKGMARIASGTAATVAGLVESGVSGLMQPGDSFALWHFNEEPFQFDFPNQVWQPDQASRRATEARIYVQNLRFNKPVRADLALREMFIAMRAVDPLTVVLISNGESPMVGTPFDVEINKVYLRRGEELRKARLPFVTTLRCVNRQIENAAVTAGREEIVLPELTSKAATAALAANPSASATTKAPPPGVAATTTLAPNGRPAIAAAPVTAPPSPGTAPVIVARERITNVFAPPFSAPFSAPATSAVGASTTVVALAPRADDAASAAKIGAPITNGTLVIAPPALPALPTLPARPEGPLTMVKIVPPSTNTAAAAAVPTFPNPSRKVESPLTLPRISAARTNAENVALPPQLPPLVSADPGSAIVQPRVIPSATAATAVPTPAATGDLAKVTANFPRKSAPSFALENAAGRSAPGAGAVVEGNQPPEKVEARANTVPPPSTPPAAGPPRLPGAAPVIANSAPALPPRAPSKPPVPERIPEPPKRNAAVTNAGGKVLATAPPLIRPETTTRPIHFLFAGLVLLAVAGWFIVLILRGSRRQTRSSISRAMDE